MSNELSFSAWRRQVKRRKPDHVDLPDDEIVLRRTYVKGLDVRGCILWLT